jgi:hypothetical protein
MPVRLGRQPGQEDADLRHPPLPGREQKLLTMFFGVQASIGGATIAQDGLPQVVFAAE